MTSEIQKKKSIIQFIEKLSTKDSVEELLALLFEEVSKFKNIKNIFLLHKSYDSSLRLLYTQSKTIKKSTVTKKWSKSLRLKINDNEDRKYLVEEIKRPVGKLIRVPVQLTESLYNLNELPIVFYFEHDMNKISIEKLVSFLDGRLSFLSKTLEKIFISHSLKESSLLWESTFNAISDPIAILNEDSTIHRSNIAFDHVFKTAENYINAIGEKSTIKQEQKIYDVHTFPVQKSETKSILHHCVDVTRSYELQGKMIQNEKMSAIGHLAGNIAHSLNNPLTGLRSMAQVLIAETSEDQELQSDLKEVEKACLRSQAIINNLLEFSKGHIDQKREKVSLSRLVYTTLPFLKSVLYKFKYDFKLDEKEKDFVYVVPDLFKQVIFNIMNNACQATDEGGTISVFIDVDKENTVLLIKDTGCGMDEETKSRIFESFFTTKKAGEGTGLGLSMSRDIVESAGGTIKVNSQLGEGTEFCISLPTAGKS